MYRSIEYSKSLEVKKNVNERVKIFIFFFNWCTKELREDY